MTLGEYRVGIDFNPSGDERVNTFKRRAADFIDCVDGLTTTTDVSTLPPDPTAAEIERLKALAITHIENAAMWAVKAATKRKRED